MSEFLLEEIEGAEPGRRVALDTAVEIGRDAGAQVVLADNQVSRRHARLSEAGGVVTIEDLGSRNGTYVNEQPLHAPVRLGPGDRVRLGLTVFELRTRSQVAAVPSAAPAGPQITSLGRDILIPVAPQDLPAPATPVQGVASFLVEESEPAFVPQQAFSDDGQEPQDALSALVDVHVKRQTNVTAFALLGVAGLAVLIFFGVR